MEGFVQRFQQIIDTYTQGKKSLFAQVTGKKPSYITDICKGRAKPSFEYLVTLSNKFNLSLDWLIKGEGRLENIDTFSSNNDFVYVPRYDVHASAGYGALIQSEQVVDFLAFKREWIAFDLRLDPTQLALITVEGDSMYPTIQNGDLILVDMNQYQLKREAIYVLRIEGALMAKRVQRRPEGGFNIISDNKNYPPFSVSRYEADSLQVLGRVVWFGRTV